MKNHSTPQRVCLAQNRSLSLTAAKGARVHCADGGLWITQDHDLRDIVLSPGESFTFDRDGPAMVSALVGSSLELRAPQRARWPVESTDPATSPPRPVPASIAADPGLSGI